MTSVPLPASLARAQQVGAGARDLALLSWTWPQQHPVKAGSAILGLGAFLWLGHFPLIMLMLLLMLTVVGMWLWWQQRDGSSPLYPRQMLGRVLFPPVMLANLALVGVWPALISLLSAASLLAIAWTQAPEPEPDTWWSEDSLREALFSRYVLGTTDELVSLRRLGPPQHDDSGTAVRLALPRISWEAVHAKRGPLAAALGLPARTLLVSHDPDDPENVVTLWVGTLRPAATSPRPSPLATTDRTDWRQPVRIGQDSKGRDITLNTAENNTLLGGKPGSGKTSTARCLLGHYLLDPTTLIYGLDGKGSRADYGAVRPLTARWVWGTDEDAPAALEQMLAEVLGIVQRRNASEQQPDGGWPGVLVLLEELQDVRSAADSKTQQKIDDLTGRIVRMGRAVDVHLVVSTQRPSVADVPAGVRNLVTQNIALMTRNPEDAKLVLGLTPTLPLPTRRGEGIYATPADVRAVELDLLDSDAWRALLDRAAAARRPVTPTATAPVQLVKMPPAAAPTLLGEATAALQDGPLLAVDLHARLPETVRPSTVSAMGKALAKHPQVTSKRTSRGSTWALSPVTDRPDLTSGAASARSDAGSAPVPSLPSGSAVVAR